MWFIGGALISILFIISDIFFPRISFLIGVIMGIWWGVPLSIAVIFMVVALLLVVFRVIAELLFAKTIEINCQYCNGSGKIEVPFFDREKNIKTQCEVCHGEGRQRIKIWK